MSKLLMVRPCCFGFNPQTAVNNAYQVPHREDPFLIQKKALAEFDAYVALLRKHRIDVVVAEDTPEPHTPDSIFPKQLISFHPGQMAVLYPMYAPNRRLERKNPFLASFRNRPPHPLDRHESPREGEPFPGRYREHGF
jgi:hypothetical protein